MHNLLCSTPKYQRTKTNIAAPQPVPSSPLTLQTPHHHSPTHAHIPATADPNNKHPLTRFNLPHALTNACVYASPLPPAALPSNPAITLPITIFVNGTSPSANPAAETYRFLLLVLLIPIPTPACDGVVLAERKEEEEKGEAS